MITLEKILTELQPESMNEIVGGGRGKRRRCGRGRKRRRGCGTDRTGRTTTTTCTTTTTTRCGRGGY